MDLLRGIYEGLGTKDEAAGRGMRVEMYEEGENLFKGDVRPLFFKRKQERKSISPPGGGKRANNKKRWEGGGV